MNYDNSEFKFGIRWSRNLENIAKCFKLIKNGEKFQDSIDPHALQKVKKYRSVQNITRSEADQSK